MLSISCCDGPQPTNISSEVDSSTFEILVLGQPFSGIVESQYFKTKSK